MDDVPYAELRKQRYMYCTKNALNARFQCVLRASNLNLVDNVNQRISTYCMNVVSNQISYAIRIEVLCYGIPT